MSLEYGGIERKTVRSCLLTFDLETFTFKKDLASGKAVNVTNAIKAKSVVSCTPAREAGE